MRNVDSEPYFGINKSPEKRAFDARLLSEVKKREEEKIASGDYHWVKIDNSTFVLRKSNK